MELTKHEVVCREFSFWVPVWCHKRMSLCVCCFGLIIFQASFLAPTFSPAYNWFRHTSCVCKCKKKYVRLNKHWDYSAGVHKGSFAFRLTFSIRFLHIYLSPLYWLFPFVFCTFIYLPYTDIFHSFSAHLSISFILTLSFRFLHIYLSHSELSQYIIGVLSVNLCCFFPTF